MHACMNGREREKKIFSFEPTNLLKACSTQIGLLTSGMSLHRHLNVHVVHPIIKEKLYRPHLSYSVLLFFEMKATAAAFHVIHYKDSIEGNVTSWHLISIIQGADELCTKHVSVQKEGFKGQ